MTNVNTAFYAERQTQLADARDKQRSFEDRIASGKLKDLGNGTYKVDDPGSYDNGEVWTYNQVSGLVLPQTGLDTSLGTEALAYRQGIPVWHELGNPIPEEMTDLDEILTLGGVNYSVVQRPVKFLGRDLDITQVPGYFVNARDDTWSPLGVVGKVYQPFQNAAAFEFALEVLGLNEGVVPESIGATRGGRRAFMTLSIPEGVTIDPSGINERMDLFLALVNSHDGSTLFQAMVTPWLILCGNTERFALRDAVYKWGVRHTKNADKKAAEARRNLGLTLAYQKVLAEEETKLAQNEMLISEFHDLMVDVFKRDDDEDQRTTTMRDKREEQILGEWHAVVERTGPSAYAAERAFTGYFDNLSPRNKVGVNMAAARATAIIEDTDTKKKSAVHERLMLRVR